VIEMTALVDPSELGGHTLVYLPKYALPEDPIFDECDSSIQQRHFRALERMYPHFRPNDVVTARISRVRHVFALPTLHYSDRVPAMICSMRGVYFVNSSQIVHGTLNVNETVQLAERAILWIEENQASCAGQSLVGGMAR
jgi:hypothetical protein